MWRARPDAKAQNSVVDVLCTGSKYRAGSRSSKDVGIPYHPLKKMWADNLKLGKPNSREATSSPSVKKDHMITILALRMMIGAKGMFCWRMIAGLVCCLIIDICVTYVAIQIAF